ncbi:MAG: glutathione S-transferase family protein [Gammaproteobacteria bacterium]|nr:glutathione S-transferase family protein [Gammaproteobacteria bacterium]HJP37149.1 glutathione S-transferase family protein [Gammaproteobacteria bacterium]
MPIYRPTDPAISTMKGIHVYQYFMSNCAQRVCLALEEKGLDWTPHAVNLFKQENTSDEYFKINPKGLVPAMVHDGTVITESIDILRYLEERVPEPALYPPDPAQRKEVDDWMDLATERHIGAIKTYMYSLALGSSKKPEGMAAYREKQPDPELIAFHEETMKGFSQEKILAAEREVFAFYDDLEEQLGQHHWLVGDEFSYADITWFVQYFLMSRTGIVDFANYPNICRWAGEIMRRPSFENGVARLQPWYAPLVCRALRLKSRIRRGGPPPRQPRLAAA